ncbi:RuBisCO accumulation factor 1 [Egbenema bharatensis]|uniref:RuBisCO accumulation factor 1 n=1 Tax=Egbenema bharatensis TaxID=3463334 RepID=UPI003A85E5B3
MPSDETNPQPSAPTLTQEEAQALFQSLRRKEGNWVAWGQACQILQKAKYSPQQIFEETGFEAVQQNQVIVAAQVYESLVSGEAAPEIIERFNPTGSDILYEFRILSQPQRVAAATIFVEKKIDSEGAREMAKALKEFSRITHPPEAFASHPSDAIAYYYWKLARQQDDLQLRSRLIAQALRFAHSPESRQQVEKLLTDFTVTRSRLAPRLPFYRIESAEEQPRIIPVAGKLPLNADELKAVPFTDSEGRFQMVKFSGTGAWVALPSWQVVLKAEDPVMVLAEPDHLPSEATTGMEEVMIMIDRSQRNWDDESYFVFDQAGQLQISWFETEPEQALLGKVVLVLRPKRVLDEDYNKELWQIDE